MKRDPTPLWSSPTAYKIAYKKDIALVNPTMHTPSMPGLEIVLYGVLTKEQKIV